MSRTIHLRKTIKSWLDPFCQNVAYGDASDAKKTPRIAFECRELLKDYGRVLYDLEVNVIDQGDDETWIENTADQIQEELDKKYHLDGIIQCRTYIGPRLIVREDDKDIKRRRLSFELHLYERG